MPAKAKTAVTDRRSPRRTDGRLVVAIALAIVAATALIFSSAGSFEYVTWDDPLYITDNPHVLAGLSAHAMAWAFTTAHDPYWHPLTWISHMADVQIFGPGPAGPHIVNLILHGVNAVLVFALFLQMTRRVWPSAGVGMLFAVHPQHVESVAWIAERKDLLCALFGLLAMLAYVGYTRRRTLWRYLLVLALFAAGLMAKPMLVTLPIMLLLIDRWPLERRETIRSLVVEKIPLVALSIASAVVTIAIQRSVGATPGLDVHPLGVRLANAVVAYAMYLLKTAWPSDLAAFYPLAPGGPSIATVVIAAAALLVLSWLVVRYGRAFRYLTFGWWWFLLTLLPVIGLVQAGEQARADRFTYLPLIGIFVILAWATSDLQSRRRLSASAVWIAAAVVLMPFGVVAHAQAEQWRNSIALWQRVVDVTPSSYLGQDNLGSALAAVGRDEEAVVHFRESIRLRPDFADPYNNLGLALARRGDARAAEDAYRRAVLLAPDLSEAHNNLANLLAQAGNLAEALPHFDKAVALKPDDARARSNYGNALASAGRLDDAAVQYEAALTLQPALADAANGLGALRARQGRDQDAISAFRDAVRFQPSFVEARMNLAVSLIRTGQTDQALEELTAALQLEPRNARGHYLSGVLLAGLHRFDEARRHFTTALAIDPGNDDARRALEALGGK